MKNFSGKVAAITGAGSGIGQATAIALAEKGCHLSLSDVNDKGLEQTLEKLRSYPVKVTAHHVDVGDRAAGRAFTAGTSGGRSAGEPLARHAGTGLKPQRAMGTALHVSDGGGPFYGDPLHVPVSGGECGVGGKAAVPGVSHGRYPDDLFRPHGGAVGRPPGTAESLYRGDAGGFRRVAGPDPCPAPHPRPGAGAGRIFLRVCQRALCARTGHHQPRGGGAATGRLHEPVCLRAGSCQRSGHLARRPDSEPPCPHRPAPGLSLAGVDRGRLRIGQSLAGPAGEGGGVSSPAVQPSGTPEAAQRRAPMTAPRWQLSPPHMVLAMTPALKSPAYFQAR